MGGRPGPATARIAARYGAVPVVRDAGIYVVRASSARAFAADLAAGSRLNMAEPDAVARKADFPQDPLSELEWWDSVVVDRSLTPPPVTADSPFLAVIEEEIDRTHPDMGPNIVQTRDKPPPDEHGTAVAGAAGAPANGAGIVGTWPGMRVRVQVPDSFTCSENARAVDRAVDAGASVINMSYGFEGDSECFSHLVATQEAFGRGALLVAAAGNEFAEGNPIERPGADPHIVTVAALDRDLSSSLFSSENGGIDVSAPGQGLLLPVPPQFDDDGAPDGYTELDGTSFSSPIVAAAATWLRAARPTLSPGQVQGILDQSAVDLGNPGYDVTFGWGKADLRRALATDAPADDRLEPNDDVVWVDGTYFKKDPPFFGPDPKRQAFRATLDGFEDPYDVYRAIVPARTSVQFRIKPRFGDPDLDVYSAGARTVVGSSALLGRSRRGGTKSDTVVITNRKRKSRKVLVNPYVPDGASVNAAYKLEAKKIKFRG